MSQQGIGLPTVRKPARTRRGRSARWHSNNNATQANGALPLVDKAVKDPHLFLYYVGYDSLRSCVHN